MKRKLFIVLVVSALLICALSVWAEAAKITVDGKSIEVVAYNIKGNNYFKLRDIGHLVNGTAKQFDVGWNNEERAVTIATNTAYSANDTLTTVPETNPVATTNYPKFLIDGRRANTTAYNISGSNYFKLRDVASLLDFNVVYDNATKTIGIDTSSSYEFPKAPDTIAVNPEIASLVGKTAENARKMLGDATPIYNAVDLHEADSFSNGVIVYYKEGTTGDNRPIEKVKMPIDLFFYNCPEKLTVNDIKPLFFEYRYDYDFGLFEVNYNGAKITFSTDGHGNIYKMFEVIVSAGGFSSQMKEIVYVGSEWKNTVEKSAGKLYKEYFEQNPKNMKDDEFLFRCTLRDFTGDGVPELCVEETKRSNYGTGISRRHVLTIVGGNVVTLYELKENELFWSYENGESIICSIMQEVTDDESRYYTLSSDGATHHFATIVAVYDENTGNEFVTINGVRLQPESDEYAQAIGNFAANRLGQHTKPNNLDI